MLTLFKGMLIQQQKKITKLIKKNLRDSYKKTVIFQINLNLLNIELSEKIEPTADYLDISVKTSVAATIGVSTIL